jgi:hypothetical protein
MKRSNMLFAVLMATAIAGCGGGGSSSNAVTPSDPVAPITPAPTVSLSIDSPKIALGQSAKLAWSSSNATSCTASGAWAGTQVTSGSATQTPTIGGQQTYTLTCTGAGGTSAQSVVLTVPIPVRHTSYENAKRLNIASQKIPTFPGTEQYGEGATGGVAFGDFLQSGQLSLVVFTNRWNRDSSKANPAGAIHFYEYVKGEPVDVTSKLLADTTGCVSPRRLIVADFNNDGKPDVFAACHGAEFGDFMKWPGERPRILLSQADGTYKNIEAPLNCYCHGATAGDINSDGAVDILVSDMNASRDGRASLMALMNDGKGNFTVVKADEKEFVNKDANYFMGDKPYYNAFLTLELIDFDGDGKLDLLLGSGEKTQATLILTGTGDGKFMTIAKQFPKTAVEYQVIDVVYVNNILYELLEQPNAVGNTPAFSIRKYSADMSTYTVLVNKTIEYIKADNPIFLMPYNNNLVAYNVAYTTVVNE